MKLDDKEYINYNDFYTAVFKKYDYFVLYEVSKLVNDYDERQDLAQSVRLFLFYRLKKYNDKTPLDFFVKNTIHFAILKCLYEIKNQQRFEDSFLTFDERLSSGHIVKQQPVNVMTEEKLHILLKKILPRLSMKHKIVFYSIFYNFEKKTYKELSEMIGVKYGTFLLRTNKIKKVVEEVHFNLN